VVWSEPRAGTYLPTPVAYEGGLYVLSEKGILTRFDAKTGKLNYKARIGPEAGAFTSSPWAYDGKILCLSEDGKTYVIAAGETFKLLQVNELDEMALASPAIAGERLLIRTESQLYSIPPDAASSMISFVSKGAASASSGEVAALLAVC
jgi:outer membrane protein assembly factor BamB